MRRFVVIGIGLFVVLAVLYYTPVSPPHAQSSDTSKGTAPAGSTAAVGINQGPGQKKIATTGGISSPAPGSLEAEFPIVAPLNVPNSTIQRDLSVLEEIFSAWQTNFPREGNPVGENAEITRALTGENRLRLALIPKTHSAINERGELCDRWGTPFRFHQLSGTQMEIRSAGPDRKFTTDDDAVLTP